MTMCFVLCFYIGLFTKKSQCISILGQMHVLKYQREGCKVIYDKRREIECESSLHSLVKAVTLPIVRNKHAADELLLSA